MTTEILRLKPLCDVELLINKRTEFNRKASTTPINTMIITLVNGSTGDGQSVSISPFDTSTLVATFGGLMNTTTHFSPEDIDVNIEVLDPNPLDDIREYDLELSLGGLALNGLNLQQARGVITSLSFMYEERNIDLDKFPEVKEELLASQRKLQDKVEELNAYAYNLAEEIE